MTTTIRVTVVAAAPTPTGATATASTATTTNRARTKATDGRATATTERYGTMRVVRSPTFIRRMGPVGLFLTAYDVWRRLPPPARRAILAETRRHGPRVARAVASRTRKRPPAR